MINGVTQLIMMKSDVMNDFETVKVATEYEVGGERTAHFPYEIGDDLKPVYREFEGSVSYTHLTLPTRSDV